MFFGNSFAVDNGCLLRSSWVLEELAAALRRQTFWSTELQLRSPMQIGDCARTVHESNVFIALGLASSEKQIPEIVESIGNQNSGRSH
ncbi:MAG: hypothetical protein DMG34_13645 [Acidobacteria bacterium]|nr:MAG: hypothetical protein DMG34_13645 [Acidobacteriota bacterium]